MLNSRPNLAFSFMPSDPLRTQGAQDMLSSIKPDNDPEKPPAKGPGDSYVIVLSIIGLATGSVLGFLVALLVVGPPMWVLCAAGGGLVGAAAGALVGDAIRKRRIRRPQQNRPG